MNTHISKISGFEGAWLVGTTLSSATFGVGWLMTPVEIPLWAILALTFIPTQRLIAAAQSKLPGEPQQGAQADVVAETVADELSKQQPSTTDESSVNENER